MVHELKIESEYIHSIIAGYKTFEVRRDDRNYKRGDILLLKEWFSGTNCYGSVGIFCYVSYVLRDPEYCKEGFVIMGIQPIKSYYTNSLVKLQL